MSATCYYCGWWTDINGVCICGYSGHPTVRSDSCTAWKPQKEIVTNADRIRSMTDEELADWMAVRSWNFPPCYNLYEMEDGTKECVQPDCTGCWLDWLKQEATK